MKAIVATYCKVVLKEMKHISTLPTLYKHSINANPCHHYCDYFRGEQESIREPEAMEDRLRGGPAGQPEGDPAQVRSAPTSFPKVLSKQTIVLSRVPFGDSLELEGLQLHSDIISVLLNYHQNVLSQIIL